MQSTFTKQCHCCGIIFTAGSDLAKWCSSRCTMRAYQRRRRGAPEADPGVRLTGPLVVQSEILDDPDELPASWAKAAEPAAAPFAFEGQQVRVITDEQGMPWFVAADACRCLAIANPRDALTRLDDDEKGVASTDTLGGTQSMTTVNEPGLYALVLGSRKPEARRFKRWVTHEVLPAIRKTGRYESHPEPQLPKLPPSGPAILIKADSEREAAQLWCDALEAAAASAIRRAYSVRHRGPDTLSIPSSAYWQHIRN